MEGRNPAPVASAITRIDIPSLSQHLGFVAKQSHFSSAAASAVRSGIIFTAARLAGG